MLHGKRKGEGKDDYKMERLKIEIVKYLSGLITLNEFEEWLYNDEFIKESIEINEDVLEVVSIDYRSKHAGAILHSFFISKYTEEELLILLLEVRSIYFINEPNLQNMEDFLRRINSYISWDSDYQLIENFYWLINDLESLDYKRVALSEVYSSLIELCELISEKFENASIEEKITYLKDGFPEYKYPKEVKKLKESQVIRKEEPYKLMNFRQSFFKRLFRRNS